MLEYKSNAKNVLGPLIKQLQGVKNNVLDKITREIAADLVSSNVGRIHIDGLAVDGSDIGNYSEGYKKVRQRKNKRIDKVNLSFSGTLSKKFSFAPLDNNTMGVGFIDEYGEDLYEKLEEKYGKIIWGVTQEDERVAGEIAKNRINKYLNG